MEETPFQMEREYADGVTSERGVLQAIMDNTDAHLAYLDPDFRFVAVNSTYAAGSGHTVDELLGRNHFELFPNEENQAIFEKVRETGEPVEFRAKPFEFPDQPWRGVTFWNWRLTPVKDDLGTIVGFAFSLMDVTQAVRGKRASDALNELNEIIHGTLDRGELLRKVTPGLAATVGCEVVAVGLRDEAGKWRIPEAYGVVDDLLDGEFDDADLAASAKALKSREPLLVKVMGDPMVSKGLAGEVGARTMLIVPLILGDNEYGVIAFGYVTGPGDFGDEQVDFAVKSASSLSLALNNLRLFEERGLQAEYAEALNRINNVVHRSLESEEIMRCVVEELSNLLGTEASMVQLRREGYWEVAYKQGVPDDEELGQLSDLESPLSLLIERTQQPLVVHDVMDDGRANGSALRRLGIRSAIGMPLFMRGQVIGVLFSGRFDSSRPYSEQHVDFARKVATTISLALENARLYQLEHMVAETLQESLLALPRGLPGVEFVHAYHSATEAARVGGDFYDLFEIDGDMMGITVGDVAGKGLDASVLTSLVKNTIRAHASEKGATPARILALTNDVVFKTTPHSAFVTAFFGVLDRRDGRLVYSSAGHTAAGVLRADGTIAKLPSTGAILGAFEDICFGQSEACLEIDDLLFLYTDGLTEARRGKELFGEKRVFELLPRFGHSAMSPALHEVIDEVLDFTGGELQDDLAILALRRLEATREMPLQQKLEI